jgi:hypothetical protein
MSALKDSILIKSEYLWIYGQRMFSFWFKMFLEINLLCYCQMLISTKTFLYRPNFEYKVYFSYLRKETVHYHLINLGVFLRGDYNLFFERHALKIKFFSLNAFILAQTYSFFFFFFLACFRPFFPINSPLFTKSF